MSDTKSTTSPEETPDAMNGDITPPVQTTPGGDATSGQAATPGFQIKLDDIRLSQDFNENLGVKKVLMTVPVRKPPKHEFVRVREGQEWRLQTHVLDLKEDRELYLLSKEILGAAGVEATPVTLVTALDRRDVLFLWPLKVPDERNNTWHVSALEAADRATRTWVRVQSNMHLGAYEVFEATNDLGEPKWPEVSFDEIINVAFRKNFINSIDHPVLRRLRGEV